MNSGAVENHPLAPGDGRWLQRPPGSNWGEFGPDDQIGRLNLLTQERVREAISTVEFGQTFCLSLPLDLPVVGALGATRKPPRLFAPDVDGRPNYLVEFRHRAPQWTDVMCDDLALLWLQHSTQWDSLAHMGYRFDADGDGLDEVVFYNGWRGATDVMAPSQTLSSHDGLGEFHASPRANKLGIETMSLTCVQGSGVLVDLRACGGGPVDYAALQRVMERQNVAVREGDILCLYTGFGESVVQGRADLLAVAKTTPALDGRDPDLLAWISASGIAAIASDHYAVEYLPSSHGDGCRAFSPLHEHCLFKLGVPLGELWWLADLADALRDSGRHRFLLTAPPLRLPGAVGSPVTPIATL